MAMGVEELLDSLYEMIDEARGVPMGGKCLIDRDKALDILDDVRAQFPVEFAESRKLLSTRNDYLASAKREAELIRKQAEEQAKQMVGENELMRQASQRSTEMVRQAEQKKSDVTRAAEEQAHELKRAATQYCDDLLRRAEEAVAEAAKELAQSRASFRSVAGAQTPASAPTRTMYDAEKDQ